jgi:methionyl-tRNA formyltransferase
MTTSPTPFIFFGTPNFAVGVLEELEKRGFLPSLVITALDKPRGRKLVITPPEAKVWAEKRGIPVFQPEKLNTPEVISKLKEVGAELFIVVAYGKLIPKSIIEIPKYGMINVHPSLLPKLRGASPLASSILLENKTGVTILLVDEEMDHGAVIAEKEIISWENDLNLLPKESILENMLAKEGGQMLAESIPKYISGELIPKPQEHEKATFTKKIAKEDGLLNLNDPAEKNLRKIRAFDTWPRAHFFHEVNGKKIRVIITDAEIQEGKLIIKKVLPEGGKEIAYEEFLRRYP